MLFRFYETCKLFLYDFCVNVVSSLTIACFNTFEKNYDKGQFPGLLICLSDGINSMHNMVSIKTNKNY